ncbi:hypothetical protein [Lactobacillus pentosus] [Lactiplantibacillus mudanjiangensis]|uniref:hypothetical protein n=1 Tax=Lactiplantibacillus mudanjiangensis TaxID=1296538 RepID=UPI001013F58C|nr:hypothetical protein [Lactiplantibacillus mudanjiangensis]VDG18976.1 hypothetical protein [Lactobacillus pentosus] [Lactiplantibacillus mudanjiangensis]VDG33074.1 hypothetical protein [Lactobacillus pentosus] [Lactiplantibacillus mudanjiangensis]
MDLPKAVTVADVATNLEHQLTFMDITLNEQTYPKPKPKQHGFLAKALNHDPFAVGKLTITPGRLTLADEHGAEFCSFGPTMINGLTIGIYHSVTNDYGPIVKFKDRLTVNLEIDTSAATYHLLNDDLTVIPALLVWAQDYQLTVKDPMKLRDLPVDTVWADVTATQVKAWAAGTPYAKEFQISGAKPRG